MGWGRVAQWAWAGKRAKNTVSQIFNLGERKRCEAEEGTTPSSHVSRALLSDVERTVSGSHITDSYQKNIYQSPNAQASKAEEFAQTLSPLAQIKPICSEATERNATERCETRHRWNKVKDTFRAHILIQEDSFLILTPEILVAGLPER